MTSTNINPQDLSWTELKNIVLAVSDQVEKTSQEVEKTTRQMKETDRKFKELSSRFSSTIGNLTEGLMEPEALRIFKKAGFQVNRYFTNMKKHDKDSNVEMEIDQFMVDGTTAIAMEIKTACNKSDIDHFIAKMGRFKELCPEYKDKTVYLAIASIKYNRGSDRYAHEKGLLVVRATPDNIFTLDSSEGDEMLTY